MLGSPAIARPVRPHMAGAVVVFWGALPPKKRDGFPKKRESLDGTVDQQSGPILAPT